MNREETLALWRQGKDAWNAWADKMLTERKALEERGEWKASKNAYGQLDPGNEPTRAWLSAAAADFSSHAAPVKFETQADFRGWHFPGLARFDGATFSGDAGFDGATFSGSAGFGGATFSGDAGFREATFSGDAEFGDATFSGDAGFDGATFSGLAWFHATFSGDAGFHEATFSGDAEFGDATFSGPAWFSDATFSGDAGFHEATFSGDAEFHEATFSGPAWFSDATFSGLAEFGKATFSGPAEFREATFSGLANFSKSTFVNRVQFTQATFEGFSQFARVRFHGDSVFAAIDVKRAFSLAGAEFESVPDFIQAHFAEAPRLDNVQVGRAPPPKETETTGETGRAKPGLLDGFTRRLLGHEDATARWRALRRLAIQAHDHERELLFFAGEVKAARGVTDFPIHWLLWRGETWGGISRWWMGWAYQLASDFGRSLVRPLALWLVTILLSAAYFLSQSPSVRQEMPASLTQQIGTIIDAWSNDEPCYSPRPPTEGTAQYISGLAPGIRGGTSAPNEALHLALRNAFIVLDGGADAAHRTFGCLYGVERYGENPIAVVPSSVSFASALQKLVSAILIFLFGLGVRNMLRMK